MILNGRVNHFTTSIGVALTASLTLTSLPLFPLETVLFPGGVLPLRIFEMRYLDMVSKCHRAGAPFGVVSLTHGTEVHHPSHPGEAFHAIGTLATIEMLDRAQPGLMLLRCRGTQRFHVAEQHQLRQGLWVADVERMDDDQPVPVPDDLLGAAQALQKVIASLQARQPGNAPLPVATPLHLNDCGWVANRWCELLPMPLRLKQQLMELDNPLIRLELVSDVLTRTGIAC